MIPVAFASKIGIYNVQIGYANVTVHAISMSAELLDQKLEEIRTTLKTRVVALEPLIFEHYSETLEENHTFRWLLISAGTQCLMVDLRLLSPFPECLRRFLDDETICFVGLKTSQSLFRRVMKEKGLTCKGLVSLGDLAARVKKNCDLEFVTDLNRLGREVGLEYVKWPSCDRGKGCYLFYYAVVTESQMPCVVNEVYHVNLIASRLLAIL